MGRGKTRTEVADRSRAAVQVLRFRRESLGWSQPELARRSGIGVETIRAIEQGKHPNLAFFTVTRWARVVGIPLDELEPTPKVLPKGDAE